MGEGRSAMSSFTDRHEHNPYQSYPVALMALLLAGCDGETVKVEAPGLEEGAIIGKLLYVSEHLISVELPTVGQTYFINPAHVTAVKVVTAEA